MDESELDRSAVDWVVEHPPSKRVFDELGIDYSCPGKSLRYLCTQRDLDPHEALRRLHEAIARADWTKRAIDGE